MSISISKEFMYREGKRILQSLFKLPELEKVDIKGVIISSIEDEQAASRAINECFHDIYSDIDIQIKIKLGDEDYNSKAPIYADCLKRLGFDNDILGVAHYCTEERGEVIRVCKTNGMRFDLIITAICAEGVPTLPHEYISDALGKVNNFWFIATQALGKLMRKDYLISCHLAHMLIQEALVLQMIMRDNEKGTNIHRYGYSEELDYFSLYSKEDIHYAKTSDETYNHIARLLYCAVKSYDRLYYFIDNLYVSRLDDYLSIWDCYCKDAV